MILYSFIFIQEKEVEKSDQGSVASATTGGIGQAEAVSVFYYTPLSQITDKYNITLLVTFRSITFGIS